jgi:hypothetical protein
MNTSEQWGGHGSLDAGRLGDFAQLLIDVLTESEAEKYQDLSVAGFYSRSHEHKVRPVGRATLPKDGIERLC